MWLYRWVFSTHCNLCQALRLLVVSTPFSKLHALIILFFSGYTHILVFIWFALNMWVFAWIFFGLVMWYQLQSTVFCFESRCWSSCRATPDIRVSCHHWSTGSNSRGIETPGKQYKTCKVFFTYIWVNFRGNWCQSIHPIHRTKVQKQRCVRWFRPSAGSFCTAAGTWGKRRGMRSVTRRPMAAPGRSTNCSTRLLSTFENRQLDLW